jgi:tetratricopeptide (TPR) repeat protein
MKSNPVIKRYIIFITTVYTLTVVIYGIAYYALNNYNLSILKETSSSLQEEVIVEKALMRSMSAALTKADSLSRFANSLADLYRNDRAAMAMVLFRPTDDENYFRVARRILLDPDFTIPFHAGKNVKGPKSSKYLKLGRSAPVVDPSLYKQGSTLFQYLHFPVTFKKKRYIATIVLSQEALMGKISHYTDKTRWTRYLIMTMSILLIIASIIATIVLAQNFEVIIKNMTSFVQRAAEGDLEVTMSEPKDEDLKTFAQSFNSLLDEMKQMNSKETTQKQQQRNDLFNRGVEAMKENNLEQARAMFLALVELYPTSHGSHFNLGVIHARQKDYAVSARHFKKAVELDPEDQTGKDYLARVEAIIEKKQHH